MRCRIQITPNEDGAGSKWKVKAGGEVVGFGQAGDADVALADAKAYIKTWKQDKPKETRVRVPKA